ncbi:Fic family protein [Pseudonocardia hierapolitana]|uniref:Fic family protein n=1 Tax=Pseudonocardia hierapolitana TaxID=1128676 RepID=A0A561SSH3_9PSEU|nr:Fic/DOC family N-terminal domain-containing protein [Pseudonocardia hierapolitana]TWF77819.1 Fic family protein [Pseudonocardia hierapolitana]
MPISGSDPRYGRWEHVAFVPDPLPSATPELSVITFNEVAEARAALASLNSTARQLPNPSLLRRPTLRREAQSTSALEGTYAPLQAVLAADEEHDPADANMREVLNYVRTAEHAFAWHADGRPLSMNLLTELHGILVRGTSADTDQAGRVRSIQVAIGGHAGGRVQDSRFVPRPPGPELEAQIRDWLGWVEGSPGRDIDPVIAAGMAHYHFEALHPFNDGNGRIGRLLIVLHLMVTAVITEPTLTVSPWFEARRADYYDALMAVSTTRDWDRWIRFFARGLAASAQDTEQRLLDLLAAQGSLKATIRRAGLRANTASNLVDFALAQPIFTVRQVERHLEVTYARANQLVAQLVELGVLHRFDDSTYGREFTAPEILAILLRG